MFLYFGGIGHWEIYWTPSAPSGPFGVGRGGGGGLLIRGWHYNISTSAELPAKANIPQPTHDTKKHMENMGNLRDITLQPAILNQHVPPSI